MVFIGGKWTLLLAPFPQKEGDVNTTAMAAIAQKYDAPSLQPAAPRYLRAV